MMITTTIYFENNTDIDDIVDDLQELPELIRPIYFAEDEGKVIKANVLSDEVRFKRFRKSNPTGFLLYAENGTFIDISAQRVDYLEITLWLKADLSSEFALVFLNTFSKRNPIFGFACEECEYEYRNRYDITIGKNHVESWIGRRLKKYISGVYWCTLLSNGLLDQHGVKLADLSVEAIATKTLGDDSLHLLKFFTNPEDWKKNAERLDNLCEKIAGVFSKSSVETAVQGVRNYLEYDEIIADWR